MKWLITGGAGFIGSNVTAYLLAAGHEVIVFDNLSRPGSQRNLDWLRDVGLRDFTLGDVRHFDDLRQTLGRHGELDVVLHLAGQVAVTSSVAEPRHDFETNALGTVNVLEAVRQTAPRATVINASTNKVYGDLEWLTIRERKTRYALPDHSEGITEEERLDPHSPYACSKSAADQYVRDYARVYGLATVNLRQSCIYGPRQFGIEDQGWLAWFIIATLTHAPITIYGTGKQVRDLLHIEDLARCYLACAEHARPGLSMTFNIGGGPDNAVSLMEVLAEIEALAGIRPAVSFGPERPGDQKVFVSNISRARRELGWAPLIPYRRGMEELVEWVQSNLAMVASTLA